MMMMVVMMMMMMMMMNSYLEAVHACTYTCFHHQDIPRTNHIYCFQQLQENVYISEIRSNKKKSVFRVTGLKKINYILIQLTWKKILDFTNYFR